MPAMLVVTHGRLADELVDSATRIVGRIERLEAISLAWNDDTNRAAERIREAIERVGGANGVLLLTDMFGGTPTNLALALLEPGRVEIVTGVNLPMLIKFATLRDTGGLAEVARAIAQQGRESIQVGSPLLGGPASGQA